jgi:hypothetical protein
MPDRGRAARSFASFTSFASFANAALFAFSTAACAVRGEPPTNGTSQDTAAPPVPDAETRAANASVATSIPAPAVAAAKAELPRGGRAIFPEHRLVGFCGTPGAPALGELQGNLVVKAKAMATYADKYAGTGRKVLPVVELIAVVVQAGAGADGKHRRRVPDSVVDEYLRIARDAKGLLLLNVQPGQSDFLSEVKHFERYLREPDVGVALDPEWAMNPGQRPGRVYGQTTGAAINGVAEYLSKVIAEGDLPEKALVFHQVNRYVVKDETALGTFAGVSLVKSVDGLGPKWSKIETYNKLMTNMSPRVHAGFKLFFDEDRRNGGMLMTPKEVMALKPVPEYVMYE